MQTVAEVCTRLAEITTDVVCSAPTPTFMQVLWSSLESFGIGMCYGIAATIVILVILFKTKVQELTFGKYDSYSKVVDRYDAGGTVTEQDETMARTIVIGGIAKAIVAAGVLIFIGLLLS